MLKYGDSVKQFNTKVDEDDFLELLHYCKKEFGLEITHLNYMKIFQKKLIRFLIFMNLNKINYQTLRNSKIGFTSRIESRKNIHYLSGYDGVVLSNQYDWKNITETGQYNFDKYKFYQWDGNILEPFMKLDWDISHSCHTNEPFGYSIFKLLDWGKLPIIHRDWGKDCNYKYRAR